MKYIHKALNNIIVIRYCSTSTFNNTMLSGQYRNEILTIEGFKRKYMYMYMYVYIQIHQ